MTNNLASVLDLICRETKYSNFSDSTTWATVDLYTLVIDGLPMNRIRPLLAMLGTTQFRFQKWDGQRMCDFGRGVDPEWFFGESYCINVRPR